MRKRVAVIAGLLAIGLALVVWRAVREDRPARRHSTARSRLDVAAFRAQLALRVKRAKELAARRPVEPGERPRSKAWQSMGKGGIAHMRTMAFGAECLLGPQEVCDALAPLMDDCDTDARSCIAVGQYLADTPPRILIANVFFNAACRHGDPDGCARLDDLEPGARGDCEADPWACGWRAFKTSNFAMHEEACSLGAAESCAMIGQESKDPDVQRAYYETACQLGDTMICNLLARLLSPACEDDEDVTCFPIDEDGAARAAAMACAAGFTEHC